MNKCDFCNDEEGFKKIKINGIVIIIGINCLRWRTAIKKDKI